MSIKNLLLASSLLLAIAAPVHADSYHTPTTDWDDLHFGLTLGDMHGTSNKTIPDGSQVGDFSLDGLAGGAEFGFDGHYGRFMFGVEGDVSGSGLNGHATCVNTAYQCETKQSWFATVRPRLGYAIFDGFIPYVTGGLAIGEIHSYRYSNSLGISDDEDNATTQAGGVIGGGAEYLIGRDWAVKVEYLYMDYSDSHVLTTSGNGYNIIPLSTSIIRGGVDYRF